MSGSLIGLIDALTGSSTLVLGGMVFTDFALPAAMHHGGQQQLTVHKLPGGARVIDDMGNDPKEVSWSGLWLGPDASLQRMQLEALRTAGDPIDLIWSDQALTVLVGDCKYEEEHAGRRIRYHVTCTVLPDAPDDDGADDVDYGDGQTPDTPAAAQDTGQARITSARSSAAKIPVPPIPPATPAVIPSGVGLA